MRKSYGGKKILSLRQVAAKRSRELNKVYKGPRGGKYRVVNGRKRYDVA